VVLIAAIVVVVVPLPARGVAPEVLVGWQPSLVRSLAHVLCETIEAPPTSPAVRTDP
jgi:hypothetical protein